MLEVRQGAVSRTLLGLPIGVERRVTPRHRLTDEEWKRLVVPRSTVSNPRSDRPGASLSMGCVFGRTVSSRPLHGVTAWRWSSALTTRNESRMLRHVHPLRTPNGDRLPRTRRCRSRAAKVRGRRWASTSCSTSARSFELPARDPVAYTSAPLTVAGMMRTSPPSWKTRLWISAAAMARRVGSSVAACSSSKTLSGQSPTVPLCRCGWAN